MEGTRKSTRPSGPASASAMRSATKVLPVPQAMMSLPRSAVARPFSTSLYASFWWGRRL